MTTKALESMMLVALWWQREDICRSRGNTCNGCPYDKGRVCDRVTTTYVLERAGSAFTEYFNTLPESDACKIREMIEPSEDIAITGCT